MTSDESQTTKQREAQLLLRVYEAREDPLAVAEAFDLSLEELATWAGRDRTMRSLRGLRLVADMQTQLILSRYRLTAAAKLLQLASQEESSETARKACVDLLKTELTFPEADAANEPGAAVDEHNVLKALAELGGAEGT